MSVSEITGLFLFAGSAESRCKLDRALCTAQQAHSSILISLKLIKEDWCDGSESNLAEQMVFDHFVDSINSGSVNFLMCAPPGSSSWVSSFRDIIGRGRYSRPEIQPVHKEQVGMGTLLALHGTTACAAAQKRGTPRIVEQFQPRAGEPAFFDLDERIGLCRTPGVQSSSACHHLRPHADLQPFRMASNFVPLLWQRNWDALTSSEIYQALIKAICDRPREPPSCTCRKCY